MNEQQTPISNSNEQINPVSKSDLKHHLTTVTPTSKALAMLLFILLPFVGFWLGMEYGALERSVQRTEQPLIVPITEQQEPRQDVYVPKTWSITPSEAYPFTATIETTSLAFPVNSVLTLSGTVTGAERVGVGIQAYESASTITYAGYDGIPWPTVTEGAWNITFPAKFPEGVYIVSVFGPEEAVLAKGILVVGSPDADEVSAATLD